MSTCTLTLVFTDLVNSTAMKAQLSGEDLTARNRTYLVDILTPHRQRVESTLAARGGRVVKTEGDAYFLAFGDATRAAQWAVLLQRSHGEAPISTPLGPLQVRIGMHTGAPLPDGDDYIGHEVDYAARVAALATGGQIAVSEATASLLRAACVEKLTVHPHGMRTLKGVGYVPIFELLHSGKQPQPLHQPARSPSNLPPVPDGFVGRGDVLAVLDDRVRRGLTILKGEGGMGKTTLALVWAHAVLAGGEFPGGIAWLDCDRTPDLEECMRQASEVFLGSRMEEEHVQCCQGRVVEHLRDCHALVIFDNFESIAGDVTLIRWLMELRAPASALLTTRELPSGLRGHVVEVGELPRSEAVALFSQRAKAAGADADGVNAHMVDELCAAVGDQPLAIELLAVQSARLPLSRLLRRMRRDLSAIDAARDPTRPERHQSARACIAFSYEQLSLEAQCLLTRLSVLADGAGEDAISAVMEEDDWDDAAAELVRVSLWRLAGDRYTSHPLVRHFAREQLGNSYAEAQLQVARTLARLIGQKGKLTDPAHASPKVQAAALSWLAAEWGNLLACAAFAADAGDLDVIGIISDALHRFAWVRGHWRDCEEVHRMALVARQRAGDQASEARTLNDLGLVYSLQGRYEEAETALGRSLGVCREIGDRRGEADALHNLGHVYQSRGSWPQQERALREALEIRQELGDRVGQAAALHSLGDHQCKQQQWNAAKPYYQRSLALCLALGDRAGEGANQANLGDVYRGQQRWAEAEAAYQAALAINREIGDRIGEGAILIDHAQLLAARGRLAEALAMARHSVAVLEGTEDTARLAEATALVAEFEDACKGEHQTPA